MTNKATLEIEIDGIGRVNEIHRELCKTNIVQIKSKRNQINKKLQNSPFFKMKGGQLLL